MDIEDSFCDVEEGFNSKKLRNDKSVMYMPVIALNNDQKYSEILINL